jgi:DNA-binding transcriptional LysR family regulator
MQDLNDMLYFAEVVDRGGFAAAGRALGIPKSALAPRGRPGSALGVRLLQRTTRKLSLTAGRRDLPPALRRHARAGRGRRRGGGAWCRRAARHHPRHLPGDAGADHHRPALPRFLAAHPQVRIDMQVTNRVVDLVQEGVDVALRVRPPSTTAAALVVKNLGRPTAGWWPVRSCCSAKASRRWSKTCAPADGGDVGRRRPRQLAAAGARRARVRVQHRPVYTADDLLTLKYAVQQGTGMSCCPTTCARETSAKGGWCRCCRAGRRRRPRCWRCFPRAAAWCPRCGASSISWARREAKQPSAGTARVDACVGGWRPRPTIACWYTSRYCARCLPSRSAAPCRWPGCGASARLASRPCAARASASARPARRPIA